MRFVGGRHVLVVLALLASVLVAAATGVAGAQEEVPTCFGQPATIVAEDSETTVGTDGDDVIVGTSSSNIILGGGGNDLICGLGGGDVIRGNAGNDQIQAGAGADSVFGGKGRDLIIGGKGADELHGNSGRDTIRGRAGSDQISGGKGDDTVFGGADDDTIAGNGGRDTISGGKGDDTISGGNKGDVLRGRSGSDTIFGNQGRDLLLGDRGRDDLGGGKGWDRCPELGTRPGSRDMFRSCDASSRLETSVSSNIVARAQSEGGRQHLSDSIIVPPDGKPFIALRDVVGMPSGGEEGSLRLIRCKDATCASVTETSRDPGLPSLAVGPDGRPVLSVSPVPSGGDEPPGVLVACENARCTKFTETPDVSGALAVAPDGTTYLAGFDETIVCDDPTCPDRPETLDIGGLIAVGEDGLPFFGREAGSSGPDDPGSISVVECLDAACSATEETQLEARMASEGFSPGPVGGENGPSAMVYRLPRGDTVSPPVADAPAELVLNVWDDDPATADRITIATGDAAGNVTVLPVAATIGPDQRPTVMWGRFPAEGDATFEIVVARCDDRTCDTGTIATVARGPISWGPGNIAVGDDGLPVIIYGVRHEGGRGGEAKTIRSIKCADPACTNGAFDVDTWDNTP